MEIFAVSGLINGIASLGFGFLVIYKNWKDTINRMFFLLMIGMVVWSFGYWQWQLSTDYDSALFWARILTIGSILIPPFYLHWILLLLKKKDKSRNLLRLVYVLTGLILLFSFSNLLIKGVIQQSWFMFWPQPGILYHFYLFAVYFCLVFYALYLLFKTYKASDSEKRGQIFSYGMVYPFLLMEIFLLRLFQCFLVMRC